MNDFNKCDFCKKYDLDDMECSERGYCDQWSHRKYELDPDKAISKARELNISVTDVLNLIKECNRL